MLMRISKSIPGSISPKRVLVQVLLLGWSAVCLFPIYWVVLASFKDASSIEQPSNYLPFVDFTPSLEAWRFVLFDAKENLVPRAMNSLFIGVFSTVTTLVIGGMAAYGVTRFQHRISSFSILTILLGTRILPPIVMALPLYVMAQFSGLFDSLAFLIFVYAAVNLPITIWMLSSVFGPRASDQEEAANLDGASHFHILLFILLPMVKTAVITVGLLVFIQCWNEYLFAVYLTSDHALTIPPWMVGQVSIKEAQTGGGSEDLAHLAAATVVMAFPVLLLTVIAKSSLFQIFGRNTPRTVA
jgi:multiple sugar transport system permease protein